ncbi:MAG: hypothetical protein MUE85_10020 [Microscillaceae bacterium]|jgi:hypothetical protein|nr:hypothetical protein [Microscillaceae bacterium]
MSKLSQDTLSDLNQFLKYSQNSESNLTTRPQKQNSKKAVLDLTVLSQENQATPVNDSVVLQAIEAIAQKTGIPTEHLLSNLMHQNTAQTTLADFVISDLKMKGALLLLHYQILLQEAERKVIHGQ